MITLYSKDNCPQCVQAKAYLSSHNIAYKEVKISYGGADSFSEGYISREDFMEKYPQVRAMPFAVADSGKAIGNFSQLQNYVFVIKNVK